MVPSHLPAQGAIYNVHMVVSPCGAYQATHIGLSWKKNPSDKDQLIPMHQVSRFWCEDSSVGYMSLNFASFPD